MEHRLPVVKGNSCTVTLRGEGCQIALHPLGARFQVRPCVPCFSLYSNGVSVIVYSHVSRMLGCNLLYARETHALAHRVAPAHAHTYACTYARRYRRPHAQTHAHTHTYTQSWSKLLTFTWVPENSLAILKQVPKLFKQAENTMSVQ